MTQKAPERHSGTSRNLLLNRCLTDLDRIINQHAPEVDTSINNGVWDRLDKLVCEVEARAHDHTLALVAAEREKMINRAIGLATDGYDAATIQDYMRDAVRTNDDAQAALERTLHDTKTEWWNKGYKAGKQEARNEALREAAELAKYEGEEFAGMREGVMFDRLSKKILALIMEDTDDE